MRMVRRASLVFSLTLIVAITVGYVARRSEMANARDLGLTTAAQIGASRMSAIVDAVEIAAAAGTDPEATAAALASAHPQLGICAVDVERVSCAGDGPAPERDVVEQRRLERQRGDERREQAAIAAYESVLSIEVQGPAVSVIVKSPVDAVSDRGAIAVWATTFLPVGTSVGIFAVENGIRQTATTVDSAPGVFVVAATEDAVRLPGDEQRFYVLIFTLACILFVLAGITLYVE